MPLGKAVEQLGQRGKEDGHVHFTLLNYVNIFCVCVIRVFNVFYVRTIKTCSGSFPAGVVSRLLRIGHRNMALPLPGSHPFLPHFG